MTERAERAWHWLQGELGGGTVPPLLVFIGLGDGAILEALEARAPSTRVLALEPDPQQATSLVATPRIAHWRESGRLGYLIDPDYQGADQAWRLFPAGITVPTVLLHPELALNDGVARASQRLKQILFGVAANERARQRFAPRYLVNSVRNIPGILNGSDIRTLTDAYRGTPAIVVAAGPSLDHAIPDLKGATQHALLIAADTALRPLLAAGFAPHLVVALDPGVSNARHFWSLPACHDTWLVSESALDPSAVREFSGRTFWFRVSNHEPWPYLNAHGVDVGRLDVWGSVLTAGFQLAVLAGCDPIVIVGADLAFTGGRPYARGTTYEFDWAWATAGGRTLDEMWKDAVARSESHLDLLGVPTLTTPSMLSFRDWMLQRAARCGRRVINGSGAGMLFGAGIELGSLGDFLTHTRHIARPATFAGRAQPCRTAALLSEIAAARDAIARQSSECALLETWKAFSGDAFDAEALAGAIDDATRALQSGSRHRRSVEPTPWRVLRHPEVATILRRLPESTGRRTDLASPFTDPPSVHDSPVADSTRAVWLAAAWELIEDIARSVLGSDTDVALEIEVARAGHREVSHLYAWPETTRWAVLFVEALLAAAAPHDATHHDPSDQSLTSVSHQDDRDAIVPEGVTHCRHAVRACARLTLEWLRCAGARAELYTPIDQSLRAEMAAQIARTASPIPSAWLSLRYDAKGLQVAVGGRALAAAIDTPAVRSEYLTRSALLERFANRNAALMPAVATHRETSRRSTPHL